MSNHSDKSFDPSVLSFDITDKSWITIPSDHQTFPILKAYIASNLVDRKGGYLINITSAADCCDESCANPLNTLTYDRVKLNIGYGQYTFKAFSGESYFCLYQHIGNTVGTNCGVALMENLVLFTAVSAIDKLCMFISEMINISEKPEKGKFLCFSWNIKYQFWREEARMDARPVDSGVLPKTMKNKLIHDIERFLSPKYFNAQKSDLCPLNYLTVCCHHFNILILKNVPLRIFLLDFPE
jgi:hypothetical protein